MPMIKSITIEMRVRSKQQQLITSKPYQFPRLNTAYTPIETARVRGIVQYPCNFL